jgi:hypothetical protein
MLSQENQINCDSLSFLYSTDRGFIAIEKIPEPIIPIEKIQSEFKSLINPNEKYENIFFRLTVDTLGIVRCLEILKGNNNYIDTIAINYLSGLRFIPAEQRGEKINCPISFPLRGNYD